MCGLVCWRLCPRSRDLDWSLECSIIAFLHRLAQDTCSIFPFDTLQCFTVDDRMVDILSLIILIKYVDLHRLPVYPRLPTATTVA
jgi:hypothetical protein